VEEARVYQAMLDDGMEMDEVAQLTHKNPAKVKRSLPLLALCRTIRDQIGKSPDAGGLDVHVAEVMAERFGRYGIDHTHQQELYNKVFAHSDLTVNFVRSFLDTVGPALKASSEQGFLFAVPASVTEVVKDQENMGQELRRARRGLAWLMQCLPSGVLDTHAPELAGLLKRDGDALLEKIKDADTAHGEMLGKLVLIK
jgi:hypothetical protein